MLQWFIKSNIFLFKIVIPLIMLLIYSVPSSSSSSYNQANELKNSFKHMISNKITSIFELVWAAI